MEPIKDGNEAKSVHSYLVKMAMEVATIDEATANYRISRLIASGDINGMMPNNPRFRSIVDDYMFGRK